MSPGAAHSALGIGQQVRYRAFDQLEQQALFVLDMVVQRAGMQPQLSCQVAQADGLVATSRKEFQRHIQ
ncbi:hypothetical protein D3C79_1050080 [compost metagenome]